MRTFNRFPVLLAITLVVSSCYVPPNRASSSPGNLGEAKAGNAIREFLSSLDKNTTLTVDDVAYRGIKLVSTGPILVDGDKRTVPFKLSADTVVVSPGTPTTKEFDEDAVFERAEDGKWYLTQITYLEEMGTPIIEAK